MYGNWIRMLCAAAVMAAMMAYPAAAHNETNDPPCCDVTDDSSSETQEEESTKDAPKTCKANGVQPSTGSYSTSHSDGSGGSTGWNANLNYSSYSGEWRTSGESVFNDYGATSGVYLDSYFGPLFTEDGGDYTPIGHAGDPILSSWSIEAGTGDLAGKMVLYRDTGHGRRMYIFYDENQGATAGKLYMVCTGLDQDNYIPLFTYTYDGNGILQYVEDKHDRRVTFQYTTGGTPRLVKIIEPNPAVGDGTTNEDGRVTWLEWSGGLVTRVHVGMPKTTDPDPGTASTDPTEADYYWRHTAYEYVNVSGTYKLAYIIKPDSYDEWNESTDPNRNELYAAERVTYWDGDTYTGKVKTVVSSGCGCSGGGSGGGQYFTYPSPSNNQLYVTGEAPSGVNALDHQCSIYRLEGEQRVLSTIVQMNENEQPVFILRRATDKTGWLIRYTYGSSETDPAYQLLQADEYEVAFDWSDDEADAVYNSTNDMFASRKYTYENSPDPDGILRRTGKDVWTGSGATYKTVKEWTYDAAGSKQIASIKRYVSDATSLETKYQHDTYGRVTLVAFPEVTAAQNAYEVTTGTPGGAPPDPVTYTDYRTGKRTTYVSISDTRVRQVEEVRLDADDDPDFTNDISVRRTTKYIYTDDDGGTGGLGSTTCFELYRTEVLELPDDTQTQDNLDDHHQNAENNAAEKISFVRQYDYSVVAGVWRTTKTTIDPDDLALETTYDYTTVAPECGAWGNPTTITEPVTAYQTVRLTDEADRVIYEERTRNGRTLSRIRSAYSRDGKLLSTTQAADTELASSTVYEYDKAGRRSAVYNDVADCDCGCADWTGTVRGNVTFYSYYTGTDRLKTVSRRAGWADCAPTIVERYAYHVDGKRTRVWDARGNVTVYTYYDSTISLGGMAPHGFGFLQKVTDSTGPYTEHYYDYQGRERHRLRYSSGDTLMAKTENKYDGNGRVYEVVEYNASHVAFTITTDYYYDEIGQLWKLAEEGDAETLYVYDNGGRRIVVKEKVEASVYDALAKHFLCFWSQFAAIVCFHISINVETQKKFNILRSE